MPHFVQDVEEIRQRAIRKIEEGAVTSTYGLDPKKAIEVLNEALATEIVCVLRYQHHYFMATGVHGRMAAAEFKEHADEEREHADKIAERIQQLGGKPDFNPKTLMERSVSHYIEGETLADMIREDLIAERMVVDVYREMIKFFGNADPTTRIMIEEILHDEEEHASDLADLLYVVNPSTGETEMQDPGTQIGGNQSGKQNENKAVPQGNQQKNETNQQSATAMRNERLSAREEQSHDADEAMEALGNIADHQREQQESESKPRPQVVNATQSRGGDRGRQPQLQASNPNRNNKNEVSTGKKPELTTKDRNGKAQPTSAAQQRPGAGRKDVQPANAPGTTGRVMGRRGRNEIAPADDDIAIGGQSGSSRSPKATNKNRKNRAA